MFKFAAQVSKMTQRETVQPGDVLRACTATNFVYPIESLFGASPPVRTLVVYGADNQRWPKVISALRKGLVSDGAVHLVFERVVSKEI